MLAVIAYGQARLNARTAALAASRAAFLAQRAAERRKRDVARRQAARLAALILVRRPYQVASGDPSCPKLHRVPRWQCPVCQRQWHWPRRPTACGFCPKESDS